MVLLCDLGFFNYLKINLICFLDMSYSSLNYSFLFDDLISEIIINIKVRLFNHDTYIINLSNTIFIDIKVKKYYFQWNKNVELFVLQKFCSVNVDY